MSPEGVAIIIGAVGTLIGGALYKLIKLFIDAQSEQRREFQAFLGNHMSDNRKAIEHIARSMEGLADAVDRNTKQSK